MAVSLMRVRTRIDGRDDLGSGRPVDLVAIVGLWIVRRRDHDTTDGIQMTHRKGLNLNMNMR